MENKIDCMEDLVNELNNASIAYYTNDNPIMADKEYDEKYNKLVEMQKETNVIFPNSPTERIGDIILDKFQKYTHKAPLWSLDKAQTDNELKEWYDKTEAFVKDYNLSHTIKLPKPKYILTKKYDGLTINCTYDEFGNLVKTATRGTGIFGELVSEQAKTIVNLPHKIDNYFEFEIHGEALMNKRAFNDYNDSLKQGEKPLKNLRNGSAGALRNLNVKETARRKLITYMYDIGFSDGHKFKAYIEMLEFIKLKGFPTAEYTICNNLDEINKQVDIMNTERPTLQHDVDGVVIVIDDIQTREAMGFTVKFPRWGIARKFLAEETTSTLLGVEFNTGRTGKVTPRATISPVELMGVTVNHATLNSMDDIRRKGVKIGLDVFIRRSGDVIPEILGVVEDSLTDDMIDIEMPKTCSACGSILIQDGVHYFCRNSLNCKPQIVKGISQYGSLEAMNIDGFSEQTAELFIDNGIIENVLDLYNLESKKDIIIKLPKFGLKKYNNLIQAIENSKKCKVNQFLYALGIDGIGRKASKDICNYFNNDINKIINAEADDLLKIDGVGGKTVENYLNYFANNSDREMVLSLINVLEFEKEKIKDMSEVKDNSLFGKHLYPTGKFLLKKDELKQKLEEIGAIVENSYKKSLDVLICGGDTSKSGKVQRAIDDNIPLMTEEEMMEILNKSL